MRGTLVLSRTARLAIPWDNPLCDPPLQPRPSFTRLCAIAVLLSGCAHKKRPVARVHRRAPSARSAPSDVAGTRSLSVETGKASWYGHPYHGRVAANGEIYDMEKLTAAHRTLPFDTWVQVVNLSNQKTVDVRITDRGPVRRRARSSTFPTPPPARSS